MALPLIISLVGLGLLLLRTIYFWVVEEQCYRRWEAASSSLEELRRNLHYLPNPQRKLASRTLAELSLKSNYNEILIDNLYCAAQEDFRTSVQRTWSLYLLVVVLACLPLCHSLLDTIPSLFQSLESLSQTEVNIRSIVAQAVIEDHLSTLKGSLIEACYALVGFVVFWSVHTYLFSPTAKELRFLRNLFVTIYNNCSQIDKTSYLHALQEITQYPNRNLSGSALAIFCWFASISISSFVLYQHSSLKELNDMPFFISRWQPFVDNPIKTPGNITIPISLGGSPIIEDHLRIVFEHNAVSVNGRKIISLHNYSLPYNWSQNLSELVGICSSSSALIIAEESFPFKTLRPILYKLSEHLGIKTYYLVIERHPIGGTEPLKAALTLSIKKGVLVETRPLRLDIETNHVSLNSDSEPKNWQHEVFKKVLSTPILPQPETGYASHLETTGWKPAKKSNQNPSATQVYIETSSNISYLALTRAMGQADNACLSKPSRPLVDCGLPGLKLHFILP